MKSLFKNRIARLTQEVILKTGNCLLLLIFVHTTSTNARAESFPLPTYPEDSIVGRIRMVYARREDSLIDIGTRFDLGYDQIVKANPRMDRWLPGKGTQVIIPSEYILPDAPRNGIILNVAELRMYYFPKNSFTVETFPVSIGRMDWSTPMGTTKVVRKDKNPPWYPPKSIKDEHAADGDPLPNMIPGGVHENPLGGYALRLGISGYLIHGTDERKSMGIGMRVTHGCVRMFPVDIEKMYHLVPVGTTVHIVNQPVKLGWEGDRLFMQVTTPLEEDDDFVELEPDEVLSDIERRVGPGILLKRKSIMKAIELGDGVLVEIGKRPFPM
jgi:L,D-transpeptidase ErfK/SrfK